MHYFIMSLHQDYIKQQKISDLFIVKHYVKFIFFPLFISKLTSESAYRQQHWAWLTESSPQQPVVIIDHSRGLCSY